jgi:hypothetical protein
MTETPADRAAAAPPEPAVADTATVDEGRYAGLSREQLVRLLKRRDAERQLGLVWERSEDGLDVELARNEDFVALSLDAALSHGEAPWQNLIIEGDNFDALRYLRMTHAGRIRCIYIDPPYNTGNRDFVYNDRFVDRSHRFRHSLWLDFMYPRLQLAKDLLAEDGVIFVSIDDNELFRLGMLMDRVFGGTQFVAQFIWKKVDSPNDNKVAVTPDHEYLLCYSRSHESLRLVQMAAPEIVAAYGQQDTAGRRYRDRLLKKNGKNSLRRDRPSMYFPIAGPDGVEVFPTHDTGEEARWAMGQAGVQRLVDEQALVWKQRVKLGRTVWEPYTREFAPEIPSRPWPTVWADLPTMRQAKAFLKDVFLTTDLFSTPKPVELIERVLRLVGDPDAICLDFLRRVRNHRPRRRQAQRRRRRQSQVHPGQQHRSDGRPARQEPLSRCLRRARASRAGRLYQCQGRGGAGPGRRLRLPAHAAPAAPSPHAAPGPRRNLECAASDAPVPYRCRSHPARWP